MEYDVSILHLASISTFLRYDTIEECVTWYTVCPASHSYRDQALLWLSVPVVVLICSMCAYFKTVKCNHMRKWRRFLGIETSVLASDTNLTVLCPQMGGWGGEGHQVTVPPQPHFHCDLKKNFLRRLWCRLFHMLFGLKDGPPPQRGGGGIARDGGLQGGLGVVSGLCRAIFPNPAS